MQHIPYLVTVKGDRMALIQFTRTKGPAGILSCHYCINQKGRRLMRSRCEDLVGIRHLARNYKDVERYLGQYTFEDFLNFCLVYSKYILQVQEWLILQLLLGT